MRGTAGQAYLRPAAPPPVVYFVSIPTTSSYVPIADEAFPELRHPSCAGGVGFVAFQVHTESRLSRRVTRKVTGAAYCAETGDWIPVLGWTREMERAFRDLSRRAPRAPTSRTFTRRFWGLMAFIALVFALAAAAMVWVWNTYGDESENSYTRAVERVEAVAADPSPGDRVAVTSPDDPALALWYVVRDADGGRVEIQAYDSSVGSVFELPDLDPARFTGATLTVDADDFLTDSFLGTPEQTLVLNALPADD